MGSSTQIQHPQCSSGELAITVPQARLRGVDPRKWLITSTIRMSSFFVG